MTPQKELSNYLSHQFTTTKVLEEQFRTFSMSTKTKGAKPDPKKQLAPEITAQPTNGNIEAKQNHLQAIPLNHKQYRRILKRRAARRRLEGEQEYNVCGCSSKPEFEELEEGQEKPSGNMDGKALGQVEDRMNTELEADQEHLDEAN